MGNPTGRAIGRTVTVLNFFSNGISEQPGTITRVWDNDDGGLVNVTVFPDFGALTHCGSIPLFSDRYRAEEYVGANPTQRAAFLPMGR